MGYDLEQLGPAGFQDLAGALVLEEFGPGVQVMGSGRDGGRDLYHVGALVWKKTEDCLGEVWDGYTVFQVKHKERLSSIPQENAAWLWKQIRGELDKWADSERKGEVPNYLVIITNVPLSPVPESGGHDQVNEAIAGYIRDLADPSRDANKPAGERRRQKLRRMSRLKKWRVWDGNQIRRLLDGNPGVRRAFPGFFTAADVFANLAEFTDSLPLQQLEPGLRAHARTTLLGEGSIYFDEAGSGEGAAIPVHEVVVDLPVVTDRGLRRTGLIRHVLHRGEHMLKPKLTVDQRPRHLIVTGAPGNGKTTISKFLVQSYRAAMLTGAHDLSRDHESTIAGVESALDRLGTSLPRHRRWAMRIDLAEYAQDHGLNEDSTLIRYIAEKVSKRSDRGDVKPSALVSWMKQWPWFLVLDGLDEVTEPAVRKRLIERVVELVNDAEAENCDVFVVLTTRPLGYTENISPTQFERVDLDYLRPSEAVRYGQLVTKVRLRTDLDRIEKIGRHLTKAVDDEALRNLLRTPLQVLIMTIIVGAAGQFAPDRFSLFWGYYETVFKREREKPTGFHRILREHGQQIQQLHERVGFELQVRSEAADHSTATLTRSELETVTWHVLHDAGFKPSGQDAALLAQIVDAATRRLVLIAPHGDKGYGFDVRSLQELMAAMHLTTGPLDRVAARLRLAAPSPHWRNTWIFAAGRIFSTPQDHQHQALVELVESVDENASSRLGRIVPIGPRLALDLIDDGMTRSLPKWRNRLIAHGLQVLHEPLPLDIPSIPRLLVRFSNTSEEASIIVADGIRHALAGTETARATVRALQPLIGAAAQEAQSRPETHGLALLAGPSDTKPPAAPRDRWADFNEEIATFPVDHDTQARIRLVAAAIERIRPLDEPDIEVEETIMPGLADPDTAMAVEAALHHVAAHEPVLVRELRDNVLPAIHRTAIGETLRQ